MVKIALAGGTSEVGHEILDALVATGKHDITLLSRQNTTPEDAVDGTTWVKVDYQDHQTLVHALQGVHTVLSFVDAPRDQDGAAQKALIDAAVAAGVKRFAPSVADSLQAPPHYLRELNKDKKVLEYSLFQCGLFLNYLGYPHKTTKHMALFESCLDLEHRRDIVFEGYDQPGTAAGRISLVTVQDLAAIMARTVESDGEWPRVGGLHANATTLAELLALVKKIKGKPFQVETLKLDDLRAMHITSSRVPMVPHRSVPPGMVERFSRMFLSNIFLKISAADGGWGVSDEWNSIFPDHEFTSIEAFLTEVCAGKE
ncbi:hypothetical protein B0T24DRAFT_653624 [Lasiosphaeria ovina]|uniref:NmrA-like domain-containing protein n=1 Tax=Lasiosphaeria ovina TaxID=92902 RepID=A0AAE0NJK8_9PEZI|nr:hypothetical protein B0T24DRAFT_653624 [Lasiosphaeria ovina]